MKILLLLPVAAMLLTVSCTTLENRRYLWDETRVEGPYTRMLKEKPWPWPRKAPAAQESTSEASPDASPRGK